MSSKLSPYYYKGVDNGSEGKAYTQYYNSCTYSLEMQFNVYADFFVI